MTAGKRTRISNYWQRLTRRERFIGSLTLLVAVSWFMYQMPYSLQVRSVNALKAQVSSAGKDILDLTAQIADIRKRGAAGVSPGWELADQKSIVLFLEDVSGEARRLGINLVAVHPAQEVDKKSYKEVSMNLDLKGRYRELAEYFKRLENLSHVVNIRRIRLESCPDTASVCAAQVEAVTYMAE